MWLIALFVSLSMLELSYRFQAWYDDFCYKQEIEQPEKLNVDFKNDDKGNVTSEASL